MANVNDISILGERALRDGDVDRLGFGDVAARIAGSLTDHASADGFVIGIDGRWGSGKSSLLYLISAELEKTNAKIRPIIISFRPWLVGSRDALLLSLFTQLATAIDGVELSRGDATAETKRKAKETAEKLRKYVTAVSKTGEFIEALSFLVGALGPVGKLVSGLGKITEKKEDIELDKLKDDLTQSLRDLGQRFIITVDDVDRLEPSEVVEVLRLVRSVADFPNVIYLLCYDSEILAESVRRGADVPDGAAFLEKIVQLTVMVPQPESFQLRQWFGDEILRIAAQVPDEQVRRLRSIVDIEGGIQLRTPRAVVRTLDSFRFFWPALRDEGVDLPDLVWLLLIKDGAPKVYRWIETYLGSMASVAIGIGSVSEARAEESRLDLIAAVPAGYFRDVMYRYQFGEQLPGIEFGLHDDELPLKVHQKVSREERDAAIKAKRLASPDHYRLYVALSDPSHVLTQGEADELRDATESSSENTAQALQTLIDSRISAEFSKADLLLERLRGDEMGAVTPEQAERLLLAFAEMMDDADPEGSDYGFMISTTWDRAERLVRPLLAKVPTERRSETIDRMFAEGRALGWLSSLFRAETFAHGHHGDQRKPLEQWVLSEDEYARVASILLERYRALSLKEFLSLSRPLNTLFAWSQGGDEDGPKALVAKAIATDEGLLDFLIACSSAVHSSDRGTYEVIRRDSVQHFIDFEDARLRVGVMKPDQFDTEYQGKLQRLRSAFAAARN